MKLTINLIGIILAVLLCSGLVMAGPFRVDENLEMGTNDIYNATNVNATTFNGAFTGNITGNADSATSWDGETDQADLNVNHSATSGIATQWYGFTSANLTQFSTGLILQLKESWLSALFDTHLSAKTTDDLTEGSLNLYDNQSWNESAADGIYIAQSEEANLNVNHSDTATSWASMTSIQSKWFSDLSNVLTFDEAELNSSIVAYGVTANYVDGTGTNTYLPMWNATHTLQDTKLLIESNIGGGSENVLKLMPDGYEPIFLSYNRYGLGGASFEVKDYASGGDWKTRVDGSGYFVIEDVNTGLDVFKIQAGSAEHSLFIGTSGNIGVNTDTPSEALDVIGNISASDSFIGDLIGNADTATDLAANPTDCSAGYAPQTIDTKGNFGSCTEYLQSESYVGTVTSVATTSPISGGTITGSGTISLAACANTQFYSYNGTSSAWECATPSGATYSAGNGISLSGTTFSVAGNTALTQDSDGLSVTAGSIGDTQIADVYINQALTTTSAVTFKNVTVDSTDKVCLDGVTCAHYIYYNGTHTVMT